MTTMSVEQLVEWHVAGTRVCTCPIGGVPYTTSAYRCRVHRERVLGSRSDRDARLRAGKLWIDNPEIARS